MEKKSNHLIGCIICGLLTAFGVVASIVSLLGGCTGIWFWGDCVYLVLFCLIAYYAFWGYKNPHGDLLKYIILIRAAQRLAIIPTLVTVGNTVGVILRTIEIGVLCYIAGRLAKMKENLILMIIATICLIVDIVLDIISGTANVGIIVPLSIWLDICVAYFLRYKEHREAGLMDRPKK